MTEMFRFETERFVVVAKIVPDQDYDASCDDAETLANIESGLWQVFGTIVTVSTRDGIKLAQDSLWGSVYSDPREFFTEHRDSNPLNRNSSIMRAARGEKTSIGHYFPDMVREAIGEARKALCNMPKVRC